MSSSTISKAPWKNSPELKAAACFHCISCRSTWPAVGPPVAGTGAEDIGDRLVLERLSDVGELRRRLLDGVADGLGKGLEGLVHGGGVEVGAGGGEQLEGDDELEQVALAGEGRVGGLGEGLLGLAAAMTVAPVALAVLAAATVSLVVPV